MKVHVEDFKKVVNILLPVRTRNVQHDFMMNLLEPAVRALNEYDYTYKRTFLSELQLLG